MASVLIVDDEQDFLEVLSERLEMRGLRVFTAPDGSSALSVLKEMSFDAIILDLRMPGMDGIDTLRAILAADPEAQVLLLTGQASINKGVQAIKEGAMDFLQKPPDLPALVEAIDKAAEKRLTLLEERSAAKIDEILKRRGW